MWVRARTSQQTTKRGAALTIDDCPVNEASIITTWNDGTSPSIVTTGDTIGIRVLGPVRSLLNPPESKASLGIFKVPHHGSQRNSQVNTNYHVKQSESNREKNHYLFLSLASWFLSSRPSQSQPRPDPDWIQRAKNDVITNWQDEWIKGQTTYERNAMIFAERMQTIVEAFWRWIRAHKLRDANTQTAYTVEKNLRTLTVRFAERHFELLRCVYREDTSGAQEQRDQNYLNSLEIEDYTPRGGWKKFKLEQFRNNPEFFPPSGKRDANDQNIPDPECVALYDLLLDDPSEHAVYIAGMINFYKAVRATRYAISANGEYGHPSPNTVAALMVSAIEGPDSEQRRQLFVTDGAALKVDYIQAIVSNLLEQRRFTNDPLPSNQWRNKIGVYYLDTDYCAPIPSTNDLSEVPGCRELDFGAEGDSKPARDLLHKQFTQTSAYDVPRAAEPRTSSFEIFISLKHAPGHRFSLSFDSTSQTFQTVDQTNMLFHLSPVPVDPPAPQNPTNYEISASPTDNPARFDPYTASSVILRPSGRTSRGAAAFYLCNSNGLVLSYKSDTKLDFQPAGDNAARLSFNRKDGFGSPPRSDAAADLELSEAVVVDTPFVALMSSGADIEPDPELLSYHSAAYSESPEAFLAWWKRVNPTSSSSEIRLLDVAEIVFGKRAQSVFESIPSNQSGFIFSNVREFQVDADASPPVTRMEPEAQVVECALVLDHGIKFPGFAGLDSVNVTSLKATMSARDSTFELDVDVLGITKASCHFSFGGRLPLEHFIEELDAELDPKNLTLAALGAIIIGPDRLWAFMSNLPESLTSALSLPKLLVSYQKTKIEYTRSPFGLDVTNASIAIAEGGLSSITAGAFTLAMIGGALEIVSKGLDLFDIELQFTVELSVGETKLQCSFTAASDGVNPVVLDVASHQTAPSDILAFLGFDSALPPLSIPLGGGETNLSVALHTAGFTLVQPSVGSTALLDLATVYFKISADWKPWEKVLPTSIQPKPTPDLLITVALVRPKPQSPFAAGLQLDYALDVEPSRAKLLFQMSHWPMKGSQNSYRTSVGFRSDDESGLPPASIDDVLAKLAGTSWKQVTDSIPALGSITKAVSIIQGSLAIDDFKRVSGFSIQAEIRDLVLLSSPSLKVEAAELIVDYNGTSWNGRFASYFLFADKYRCAAEVVLPSVDTTGRISFQNLDDRFTTGELAKAINPSIDLATVPIIGGSFLANLRLEQAAIEIVYAEKTHSVSSFLVALTWDSCDIGRLKTSNNRLSIGWHKGSPAWPIRSIDDSGASEESTGTGSTWEVNWEGTLFTDWHLSAILRRSSSKTADGESKSVIVVSGAIIDSADRIQSGSLINSFTSTSSTSLDSNGSLWDKTVPSHVTSSFKLRQCTVNLVLGDDTQTFGVGARATWGKAGEGTGLIMVERVKDSTETDPKWGFAFAISVSNFRFSDFLTSSSLAQTIDDTLAITRVSVLVFRNPKSTGMSRVHQLVKNALACGLIPPETNLLPPENPDENTSPKLTTGAAVFALLNFKGAKEGSLTHRLDTIGDSGLSSIELMGFFGKGANNTTTTIFSASISSIKLFESVTLEKIKLSYAPVVSSTEDKPKDKPKGESEDESGGGPEDKPEDEPDKLINTFLLAANCRIQFSSESSWDIEGKLTVTKQDAKLAASLKNALKLSETFGLAISEIDFSIEYTFSNPSDSPKEDADEPDRKSKSVIKLGAKAQILSIKAEASIEFDGGKPAVLLINVPSELSVSDLLNQIFDTTIPSDVLDIRFSKFFMYYAWKALTPSSTPDDPKARSYVAGFHAEADTDIFGVGFVLAVDILGGDERGVTISGTKKTPVEVLGLTLHGATSETEGPRFSFSTGKNKGCSIAAGLKVFGTSVGSVQLAYKSESSQFLGSATVKAQFLPGGQASVSFELTKKDGKHVFRLVELPAVFDDLVKAIHIIDTIRKLSALDGNPCGAMTLAFDQIKTKLHVKVKIPDSQKGVSPDKGTEGSSQLNLSIIGSFDVQAFDRTISSIEFRPFIVTIDIPKSFTLEDFGKTLASSLEKSAGQIVQGLWENQDKFMEVMGIVVFEKLAIKALTTIVCRGKYNPGTRPGDKPGRNQKPKGNDRGGPDGDGGRGGTKAAADVAGAIGGILGGLLGLVGRSSDEDSDSTPPKRPQGPPGPPPIPPKTDIIGLLIHDAITKDFTRWKHCTNYQTAIDTALACALEYRSAVFLLRKVLGSEQSASNLGERVYNDYTQRLDVLLYDFSVMSRQFAEQWLNMTDYEIELRVHSPSANGRKLDISWDPLRLKGPMLTAVTVQIEGEKEPRLKLKTFENATKTTIDIPAFSDSTGLAIKVQVSAFGAVVGGDPKYAFFSQGKPAYGLLEEVPIGTTTLDFDTKFPAFTLRDSGSSLIAKGNTPVFLMGAHRYWPMNFVDGRNSIGLVAQSIGTLTEATRWTKEGDKSINRIDVEPSTVTFTGESGQGVVFTLEELSLPSSQYLRTRVAIRDASSQPPIPFDGPKYETSVQDVGKYPVALVGSRTWWPVLYPNSSTIALVGYESDLTPVDPVIWGLDSAGSGRIGRLEHISDQSKPNNNRVEVYDTDGQMMTVFGFESLVR
ncbi:hypothetical protein FRC09_017556 [Ceratobasidium sp. 395]|nr:hypothetical protein FRC09_017556 [Ceratobasidium sp. 395]